MKKIVLAVIVCALLAAGVAYGGYRFIQGQGERSGNNTQNMPQNGFAPKPPVNNRGGDLPAGGLVAGEISAVESDNITLKTGEEGSKIVFYSDKTKITVYEDITRADLAVKDKVMIAGNTGEDGTVMALSVQVGSSGVMNGMMNRQGRPDAEKNRDSGDQENDAKKIEFFSGEIISIANGVIVVKDGDGAETSFAVSDKAKYSKVSDGFGADLILGKIVMVAGTANTDGSITAKSIQIRPELPEISEQNRMRNPIQKNNPSGGETGNKNFNGRPGGGMFPGL